MSPQEKAQDLIDEFIQASVVTEDEILWYHPKPHSLAKKCALLLAEEVLNSFFFSESESDLVSDTQYWLQVKSELLKL